MTFEGANFIFTYTLCVTAIEGFFAPESNSKYSHMHKSRVLKLSSGSVHAYKHGDSPVGTPIRIGDTSFLDCFARHILGSE